MARGSDEAAVEAPAACWRSAGLTRGWSKVRESGKLATATGVFASVSRWRHRWAPSCLVMPVAEACQPLDNPPSPCWLPFSLSPCEQILLLPLVAPLLFHFGVNSFRSLQSCHSAVVKSGPALLFVSSSVVPVGPAPSLLDNIRSAFHSVEAEVASRLPCAPLRVVARNSFGKGQQKLAKGRRRRTRIGPARRVVTQVSRWPSNRTEGVGDGEG